MEKLIIKLLKEEVKPAMGCTEPIAVALAAAKAKEVCECYGFQKILLKVSPNIYKNGLAVGIPHTNYVGLKIAALVGYYQGNADDGLSVLQDVDASQLPDLNNLIENGLVTLEILDTDKKIMIDLEIQSNNNARVVIEDKHDHFSLITQNGNVLKSQATDVNKTEASENFTQVFGHKISEIIQVIETIDTNKIEFMMDGYRMNKAMAEIGLKLKRGMGVGYNAKQLSEQGIFAKDLSTCAAKLTAAASDARMAGVNKTVMSSNGSGNNGLTAILPIVAYAEKYDVEEEKIIKAIAISHVINSYIKNEIGRLSSICSCSVSAGSSASAALVWLMGGSQQAIEGTIKNIIGNISGMICDGAKNSCAFKLFTSAQLAVQSAYLATEGTIVPHQNGIVNQSVEQTIKNLGVLSKKGMQLTDSVLLDIMINND